jgi:hypothetical protein
MNAIKYKSIEIVGTELGSDGRTCGIHATGCGNLLESTQTETEASYA